MRPFLDYALEYLKKGWQPFPLPRAAKWPPPGGVTGRHGDIKLKDVEGWIKNIKNGDVELDNECNIGIRVPVDVVGLDVDNYGNKKGGETLEELESRWGALPECPISTARDDGISGIRFFRCSGGLVWPGSLGSGIDVIQYRHRYAVAAPSIHPDLDGLLYRWLIGNDKGRIPRVSKLNEIPLKWKAGVDLREYVERERKEVADVSLWLEDLGSGSGGGECCRLMERGLKDGLAELEEAEEKGIGAHDVLNRRTYNLIALGAEGHSGVVGALGELCERFTEIVCNRPGGGSGKGGGLRRSKASAEGEIKREIEGAVRIIAAEGGLKKKCSCGSGDLDPVSFVRTDWGNAEHLVAYAAKEMNWIEETREWITLDTKTKLWVPGDHPARRKVKEISEAVLTRAAEIMNEDDEDPIGPKLYAHGKNMQRLNSVKATLELARSLPDVSFPLSGLNSGLDVLSVGDGKVVEFNVGGIKVRELELEDRVTKSTAVPYISGAGNKDKRWNKTLDLFLPDKELRDFFGRVLVSALLGGNREKLLVFLHGGTGSGKSTILDAVISALGKDYGSTFSSSVFRENKDEKARPDLIKIMDKRIVYADEASSEWNLHPDQIKKLTGGGKVSARQVYGRGDTDLFPQFTPFIATNVVTKIEQADEATFRRILVVPFDAKIGAKEQANARQELVGSRKSLISVLAWIIEYWDSYIEIGLSRITWPACVVERTNEFHEQVNEFQRWFSEYCVLDSDSWEIFSELYLSYEVYFKSNGMAKQIISPKAFAAVLDSYGIYKYGNPGKTKPDPKTGKRETIRKRKGVRFKT